MFLKVSPTRGVVRFDKRGKLRPRFIGSYTVEKKICEVAYRLRLPASLLGVHNVFHVSVLKKVLGRSEVLDPSLLFNVKANGTFKLEPVALLRARMRKNQKQWLIHWLGGSVAQATWEHAEAIQRQFPSFVA